MAEDGVVALRCKKSAKELVLTLDWSVVALRHKLRQLTYQGEAVGE
jgi:hypothetical protein